MKVHKDWIGSKKAATKGDLADLQEDIHVDLQGFATKEDVQGVKEDVQKVKKTMETVLAIVKDIDRHNKENRDIPGRVRVLESDVLKLKFRR